MEWLKLLATGLGLADFWSKWFGKQSDQQVGADLQKGATDAATIKTILDTTAPVSGADIEQLWDENKTKFGAAQPTGGK